MPLWPFGGTKVDSVSRVVTVQLSDGHTVRGKLTIHFANPRAEADANELGNRVAEIAAGLLREQRTYDHVVGEEERLGKELFARYPRGTGETRGVELAALHVVGDVALSDATKLQRKSSPSGSMPAVKPSVESPTRPSAGSTRPPDGQRRRSSSASSSMRAINTLLLPPGSPPPAIAAYVAPLVIETAARLLIGALRAHDLLVIRNVSLDEPSAEMLASLVTVAEAPPGGYDAGRVAEIARWQTALGNDAVGALRKAMNAAASYLARAEMIRAEVPEKLADEVLGELAKIFPKDAPDELAMTRYRLATNDFENEVARAATDVLEGHPEPTEMRNALAPLIAIAREDAAVAAQVVQHAAKAPAE